MSRRGRLPPLPIGDNENTTNTANDFRLSPYGVPPLRDPLKPQPWRFKKKTTIHPSLTNYGPESLQCFLRGELEKLKHLALEHQRKQILDLAKTLVNYSRSLRVVHHTSTNSFSIVPIARATYEVGDIFDKGKGKAPLRGGSRQKSLADGAQRDTFPRREKSSSTRGGLQTIIHRATRSSNKSKLDAPNAPTGIRAANVPPANSEGDPVLRGSLRRSAVESQPSQSTESPLRDLSLNPIYARPTRKSLRLNGPQKSTTQYDVPRQKTANTETMVEETFDTLDDLTLYSDAGSNDVGAPTNALDILAPSPGRLTRAASFETHADHTRDFRRTRDRTFLSSNQPPEDSRRRRKTPTHSQGRPSSSLPSAFATQLSWKNSENQNAVLSTTQDVEEMDGISANPTIPPYGHTETSSADLRVASMQSQEPQTSLDTIVDDDDDDEDDDRDLTMFDVNEVNEVNEMKRTRQRLYLSDSDDDFDDFQEQREEQQAILDSISQIPNTLSPETSIAQEVTTYDYSQTVPEDLPRDIKQAATNRYTIWHAHGHDSRGKPQSTSTSHGPFSARELDPQMDNILNAQDEFGEYKRSYVPPLFPHTYGKPPFCPPLVESRTSLPHEIWEAGVLEYLSSAEVRSLRLVCKSVAEDLEPYVFRSVVAKFSPSFFNVNASSTNNSRPDATGPGSMLEKFGPGINKFGIAFEYDQMGMTHAPFKVTETTVSAWFGKYKWPVKDYPYFASLKEIDMLLDDQPRLLTQAMKNLHNCHELALSVDSGHGWLEGPDMSDLALYRHRAYGGSKIFGKTFAAEDSAYEEGMKQLFEWAQRNTINENIKNYERAGFAGQTEIERLRDIAIRDYDTYRVQHTQPDYERDLHTGKEYVPPAVQANNIPGRMANHANQPFANQHFLPNNQGALFAHPTLVGGPGRRRHQRFTDVLRLVSNRSSSPRTENEESKLIRQPIQPQWPLIFNGYNVSADVGGDLTCVQERLSNPVEYPLMPGNLSEAQAQWIMETSWIQRTFLSSYTDAIRTNAAVFKNVHSLHISKISSGLLSSLSQKTFWSSLPDLRKLTIFVKADWRVEHIPGDKFYHTTMSTKLIESCLRFMVLLRDSIARIETLNNLHIGYCSGGEHQKGIFGRNQHVLPAPIVSNPRDWLLAQNPINTRPEENTMITFPHVRNLTFENCWFSPLMLETFMQKSHDSSLHDLVLDSVSLTAQVHSTRTDGPLRTFENQLKCVHPPGAWLQETLPANASWVNVLNKITPGRTILDQKYDASMINEEEVPRPEAQFRGNTQSITLNSCGYAKIQNISVTEFNQNELVFHSTDWNSLDEGLKLRAARFTKTAYSDGSTTFNEEDIAALTAFARHDPQLLSRARAAREQEIKDRHAVTTQFLMQGGQTAQDILFGLTSNIAQGPNMTGSLTQCIHPIEKRILEQNWGMKFGWGDDMRRWEAVEDGWFIGGTGRFSGKIYRNPKMQDRENSVRLREAAKTDESIVNKAKDEVSVPDEAAASGSRGGRSLFSGIFGGAGASGSGSRQRSGPWPFDMSDEDQENEDGGVDVTEEEDDEEDDDDNVDGNNGQPLLSDLGG